MTLPDQVLTGDLSPDGRWAVSSTTSALVAADTNSVSDVYALDQTTGQSQLVSLTSGGRPGRKASYGGRVSRNGRFIAFTSEAGNLRPARPQRGQDVLVRELRAGATHLVSVTAAGSSANASSGAEHRP